MVTTRRTPTAVIPAKAGIHFDLVAKAQWIPAFAGMTGWGNHQV
jgi:hypothetical protein